MSACVYICIYCIIINGGEEGIAGFTSHSSYRAGLKISALVVNAPQVTAWQLPECKRSEWLCVNCLPWSCAGAVQQIFTFSQLPSCVLS